MGSCSNCGTVSPAAARFCMGCGARLAGEAATAAAVEAAEPREERKVVSVLFADLAGFTQRSEGADPEDVRAIVRPFHAVLRREVEARGGTLARIVGDAGLAVFGYPVAHEDDAERSVLAGLGVLAALRRLDEAQPPLDLHVRIGVNTGEAVVTYGDPAEDADDLMGDAVNTAQRLQATAPVDALVVGEATHAAVGHRFELEPLAPAIAKGMTQSLDRWRVWAARPGIGRRDPGPGPLVGRAGPLARLEAELAAVRETSSIRLVTVLGEAGMGKSRLIGELEQATAGPFVWHRGETPAYGEGNAFRALAQIVRAEAAIGDQDPAPVARRRLSASLASLVPDVLERRWLLAQVAALLHLGPPPSGGREAAFAAWGTYLERVAGRSPTVLVFDDLHWADDGMLDFVEDLAARPERGAILVLALARPELRDRRPAWGAGVPSNMLLELGALTRDAMANLLDGMVAGLPDEFAGRIMDRAAGVPLYAVEILRMLVDRGDVERGATGFRLHRAPVDVSLPPGVASLVASRIDALERGERTLLREASVLGDRFPFAALVALAGLTPGVVRATADRLAAHSVLVPSPDADADGARRLAFSHGLVREVAYSTLARRDRRSLHLAAADYYASLGDVDASGDVAGHVLAAYRAAPIGRSDAALAGRVVAALRTAADRAMGVHSADAAAAFLDEALTVAADPGDVADLQVRAAVAAQAAARLETAASHARTAVVAYRELGDRRGLARAAATLGSIQVEQYDSTAVRTLSDALDELRLDVADERRGAADDPAEVELLASLARAYVVGGRQAEAAATAEQAVRRAERLGLVEFTADGLAAKGAALVEDCRVPQGSALLWASVELAERHGFIGSALRARSSLATGLIVDDPSQAERIAREGLETARRVGLRGLAVRVASNWADAAVEAGRWADVERVLMELGAPELPAVDRVDLLSVRLMVRALRGHAEALSDLTELWTTIPQEDAVLAELSLGTRRAWAYMAAGRPAEALADAERAIRAGREYGRRSAIVAGTVPAAHAALWVGDADRLGALVADLRGSGLDGWWFHGVAGSLEAGLAALRGDPDRAIARYTHARAVWHGLEAPLGVGLAELEAARLLPADSPEAATAADAAGRILAGLGAGALLDRLATGLVAAA